MKPIVFWSLEIEHKEKMIKIHQTSYAKKILERFNFANQFQLQCSRLKVSVSRKVDKPTKFPYRQSVGTLMYLMLGTRPDLAYSVGSPSKALENPCQEDIIRIKRVLRYLVDTLDHGIVY